MNSLGIFLFFLAVRLLSVLVVKTWYVPDEYWQSLEVGHKLAFGYGHLTWEWTHGIRSYIYPLTIAGLYKILEFIKFDNVELLVLAPRIFQAILSTFADYRFYIWTGKRKWSIFILSIAWFWFYTSSRTIANTLETSLTVVALSYYPWHSEDTHFLWLMSLCCFIRPTAAITWLPLCVHHLIKSKYRIWELLLKKYLIICGLTFAICTAIDSAIHKEFICTPWEFLKYNVLQGIGEFYGTHPWYWYLNIGLPCILGITFIPFFLGVIETIRHSENYPVCRALLWSIFFTIGVLSLLPHKEFRFLLIILPMCLYITSDYLVKWSRKQSKWLLWFVTLVLLIGNVLPAWYLSIVHQKGSLEIMTHLAKIAREYKTENNDNAKFLFLMPCHSTPYYSHIHANVTMRFLTCEPNFANNDENYLDEADEFYKDPAYWLRSHQPSYPKSALPTHLIMFDSLTSRISQFLRNYNKIIEVTHTEYASDRTGKNIILYERIDDTTPNHSGDKPSSQSGQRTNKPKTAHNSKETIDENNYNEEL